MARAVLVAMVRLATLLVLLMVLLRGGLAGFGYVAPELLMADLGAPPSSNPQMSYVVRVWAIRDLVIAALVAWGWRVRPELALGACAVIDGSDIVAAAIAGASGAFDGAQTANLIATALAALVPESAALLLVRRDRIRRSGHKEAATRRRKGVDGR